MLQRGTRSLVIPLAEFTENLQPGPHAITFRVSYGFTYAGDITAVASYVVNSAPTLAVASTAVSLPETGNFEQAVTFQVGDPDGDALDFLYAVDSTNDWQLYRSGVTGSSFALTFTHEWPSPRLSGGAHTIACRLTDGLEESETVRLSLTVAGEAEANEGDGGLSGGAIAGIVIAVLVVVGGVAAAVFFFVIRKGNGSGADEKPDA
jgi:hypothetical protein